MATTLLVFANALQSFDDYLDLLADAQDLLHESGLEGVIQLASFHPDYRFEGEPVDDAANWTNRSPFPMLHLLREASVELAIAEFGDTDAIPERNTARLRSLGAEKARARVAACLEPDSSS